LPDYGVKISDYRKSYWRDNPIEWEKEGKHRFNMEYFSEALQNFTDQICKKQRLICDYDITFTIGDNSIDIRDSEQPKIEEV
jgi:hypothetical protein